MNEHKQPAADTEAPIERQRGYQRLENSQDLLVDRGPFIKRFQDKMRTYEIALSYLDGMDFSDNVDEIVTAMETASKALAQCEETKDQSEWLSRDIPKIRQSADPLDYAKHSVRHHFLSFDGSMGELKRNVRELIKEADRSPSHS
jgi:hypothetical protein